MIIAMEETLNDVPSRVQLNQIDLPLCFSPGLEFH